MRMIIGGLAALAWAGSGSAAQHDHGSSPVAVPAAVAADDYQRGLYLLHNFEYDSAAQAFRKAQAADPGNVMAFWGEAMTYNHPLWAVQDAAAARAVLARLGPDAASRRAKVRSPREALWLDAVEALYGTGSKVERDAVYHAKMRVLHEADRSDIDARTLYALATLGLAHKGRDTGIYMKAAALLEEAIAAHPDHPGLLHYMIHSYDDPDHAALGERAAARYAKVAPDAAHAQHMISHIYLALGRWEEVERANIVADQVVDSERQSRGEPPTDCGHYNEWLAYALDQQGEDSRALIDSCGRQAVAALRRSGDQTVLGGVRNPFNNWAVIAVRHGVHTNRWPDWSAIPPGDDSLIGRFELAYGRMLASRRDADAVSRALAEMKAMRSKIAVAMTSERPDDHESAAWFDRAIAQGEAIAALAAGDAQRGIELLQAAAKAEEALPAVFGPPILAKPGFELLGDELMALGRKAEAADAYRRALEAAPGRRLAQQGLAAASR